MPKRKLDEFRDDSQFRFWGIVISRFVWSMKRKEVTDKFECLESWVTQVMDKFEEDGGYIDHRQFNRPDHVKVKTNVEQLAKETIKDQSHLSFPQIVDNMNDQGSDIGER